MRTWDCWRLCQWTLSKVSVSRVFGRSSDLNWPAIVSVESHQVALELYGILDYVAMSLFVSLFLVWMLAVFCMSVLGPSVGLGVVAAPRATAVLA